MATLIHHARVPLQLAKQGAVDGWLTYGSLGLITCNSKEAIIPNRENTIINPVCSGASLLEMYICRVFRTHLAAKNDGP